MCASRMGVRLLGARRCGLDTSRFGFVVGRAPSLRGKERSIMPDMGTISADAALWSSGAYCLSGRSNPLRPMSPELAEAVYGRVCRVGFDAPGFCLVDLGAGLSSSALRRFMIDLER